MSLFPRGEVGRSFRMHQMLNIWFEKSRFQEVGRRSPLNAAAVYNWFEESMSREKVGWQSLSNASVENNWFERSISRKVGWQSLSNASVRHNWFKRSISLGRRSFLNASVVETLVQVVLVPKNVNGKFTCYNVNDQEYTLLSWYSI